MDVFSDEDVLTLIMLGIDWERELEMSDGGIFRRGRAHWYYVVLVMMEDLDI